MKTEGHGEDKARVSQAPTSGCSFPRSELPGDQRALRGLAQGKRRARVKRGLYTLQSRSSCRALDADQPQPGTMCAFHLLPPQAKQGLNLGSPRCLRTALCSASPQSGALATAACDVQAGHESFPCVRSLSDTARAGKRRARALLRPDPASQGFPDSTNDQGQGGRSCCAGLYPEGGADPKALGNCPSQLSWK